MPKPGSKFILRYININICPGNLFGPVLRTRVARDIGYFVNLALSFVNLALSFVNLALLTLCRDLRSGI